MLHLVLKTTKTSWQLWLYHACHWWKCLADHYGTMSFSEQLCPAAANYGLLHVTMGQLQFRWGNSFQISAISLHCRKLVLQLPFGETAQSMPVFAEIIPQHDGQTVKTITIMSWTVLTWHTVITSWRTDSQDHNYYELNSVDMTHGNYIVTDRQSRP